MDQYVENEEVAGNEEQEKDESEEEEEEQSQEMRNRYEAAGGEGT